MGGGSCASAVVDETTLILFLDGLTFTFTFVTVFTRLSLFASLLLPLFFDRKLSLFFSFAARRPSVRSCLAARMSRGEVVRSCLMCVGTWGVGPVSHGALGGCISARKEESVASEGAAD